MPAPELPLTGGCNCGGVRFEVSEPPVFASWCHCTRCQRRTGGFGSPQARPAKGSFRVVQGQELVRAWEPAGGSAKEFCSACGSSLWSRSPDGFAVAVRFGVFDADPGIRPSCHQFVAYLPAWAELPDDGLPRYPGQRPPDA
ncbi:MAG TPA: GFA family protein [Gaiellaceae bacterium]|nr:GFA family protein [Gaiellaceae bacterium]